MPMRAFYSRFGDLAFREMRTVIVAGHPTLPDGPYGFLEMYCDEAGCDCRRVILMVIRPMTGDQTWATINFGWESLDFYQRWNRGEAEPELAGASLDWLNPQSEHADALLDVFRTDVLADRAYVERLKRHYQMFRAAIDGDARGSARD